MNVYFLKVFSKPMYGLLFSLFLLLFVPISLSISWPVDYVYIVHIDNNNYTTMLCTVGEVCSLYTVLSLLCAKYTRFQMINIISPVLFKEACVLQHYNMVIINFSLALYYYTCCNVCNLIMCSLVRRPLRTVYEMVVRDKLFVYS